MKKQAIAALLAALLLTGCAADSTVQPEEPSATASAERETLPVQMEETVPAERETEPAASTNSDTVMVYPEPQDMVFVAVADYIPDIQTDLKYAGTDNFTGQVVYEFSTVYLRYGTVRKLSAVQEDLKALGLGLKIWDGFRPVVAQHRLWEVCPDPRYVANPNTGFSSHSRGNTVDVTLVDSEGREVVMPTGFDDFSSLADRDYSDCTQEAADNAELLEAVMEKHGFTGYAAEWWHYSDLESYPVEEQFQPTS